MTTEEVRELQRDYGVNIERAVHLHDEDEWNEWRITYKGIIVGSELVDKGFVLRNIANVS